MAGLSVCRTDSSKSIAWVVQVTNWKENNLKSKKEIDIQNFSFPVPRPESCHKSRWIKMNQSETES
jgi:hypothetical protein